ncbi:glycosyltransferase [Flavisolibacter sp. BT320]|nr:glycosyltransferase [Flavisolibacter longurius]
MKVILCLHHFLPAFIGGTEVYTFNLAKRLQKQGIEPLILIPNFDDIENHEYGYEGVRVIEYAEASTEDRQMIMGKKKPDGLAMFSRIIKDEQPDIVHFHELAPGRGINIFHVETVFEKKIPVILTFHLSFYTCMKGSLLYRDEKSCDGVIRPGQCTACIYHEKGITGIKSALLVGAAQTFFRLGVDPTVMNSSIGTALGFPFVINKIKTDLLRMAAMASTIVVLADWYKEVLLKNGVPREKLVYLPQAIEMETDFPKSKIREIVSPLKVVYIGRISEQKGLHLLTDAVSMLPEESISLTIYGPDADANYARAIRQKTASKDNIHWMGAIPSSEVASVLLQHDVLCIPSKFEMSPLVIQEAFAAGLPVLASDVYGNAEQIRNGENGWLFKYKDAKDLSLKLSMLSEDPDLVKTAKQRLPVPQRFESIALKYAELYASLLNIKSLKVENSISDNP